MAWGMAAMAGATLVSSYMANKNKPEGYTPSSTEEALNLKQAEALDAIIKEANNLGEIGKEDYDKFTKLISDKDSKSDDVTSALNSIMSSIAGSPVDVSTKSFEEINREVVLNSSSALQAEAKKYSDETGQLTDNYLKEAGIAKEDYTKSLQSYKDNIGQVDTQILAEERGKATAGVSTAYKEAQDDLMASSAQRGTYGSGVMAGQEERMTTSYARDLANQYSQARGTARGISDIYNQQRLDASQQQYQLGTDQTMYNTALNQARQTYDINRQSIVDGLSGISSLYNQYQQGKSEAINLRQASANLRSGGAGITQQSISNQQAITLANMNAQNAYAGQRAGMWSGFGSSAIGAGASYYANYEAPPPPPTTPTTPTTPPTK